MKLHISLVCINIFKCIAQLQVQQQDALPKNICLDCRQLLEKFYYFRKKSKNSDTKLRRHLRLLNAGKPSQVFNVSDDEEEDDYVESRELFELWDAQRLAAESKDREKRNRSNAVLVQKAIAEEREKFRATEAVRITAELREQLETELRDQVEQELREKLEPLMQEQIETQIERVIKQRQVEQIKREVQEVLKSQKEELRAEYRKMAETAAQLQTAMPTQKTVAKVQPVQPVQPRRHPIQEESFDQDPFPESEQITGDDINEYEVLYEDNEPADGGNQDEEPESIIPTTEACDAKPSIYTLVSGTTEEDDQISLNYQGEGESSALDEDMAYSIESTAGEQEDETNPEVEPIPNEECEFFYI